MSLVDSRGCPVSLGEQLGRGGEGAVYALADRPQFVAKLYADVVPPAKAAKIGAMARLRNERLLAIAAWPVDTVHDRASGPMVGILMPRVASHKAIHLLYTVKSRRDEFPQATWPFLIAAAANLARAFAVIHACGHVVGDVNPANAVVARNATVRLIDCDSFQISDNGQVYPCDVGSPPFQPPEFQGVQTFRGLVRTPNHDAFGLGVLIFHLLFMGRHPFAGRPLGSQDVTLEQAIREFRFVYGREARTRQMERPPHSLDLHVVSPLVTILFERAFAPEGTRTRPTAHDWISALDTLARQLTQCRRNPTHGFWNGLSACPWCEIEHKSGLLFFVSTARVAIPSSAFDLDAAWTAIAAVASPGAAPRLPSTSTVSLPASRAARRFRYRRNAQRLGAVAVALLGVVGWALGMPLHGDGAFWNAVLGSVAAWPVGTYGIAGARARARQARDTARARWIQVEKRWNREAGDRAFRAKLKELAVAREEYRGLPAVRQDRLRRLENDRAEHQRYHFLDQHRLIGAALPGVGPGREATLRSYGIETAADVTPTSLKRIPGFGATLGGILLTWRREVERQFVFDPTRTIDPQDVLRVEHDILATQARLEQKLTSGPAELQAIAQAIVARRRSMRSEVDRARQALAQAEADAKLFDLA